MAQNPVVNNIRIIPRDQDFLERNVGSSGEVFFNKETNTLRLYNGRQQGGYEVARSDLVNVTNSDFLAKATAAGVGGGSTPSGGASVDVSDTAPDSPEAGNIWLNSTNGRLYVYVTDDDSSQWIQPSYPTFSGDFDDLSNKPTSILDFGINDGTNGQLLQTDGNGNFSFVSGTTYDQTLNTSDDVEFNTVSATEFVNSGVGETVIDSATTITLTAQDGVFVTGSPFRLPSFTTTQRNALVPSNGDLIYNSTANKIQGYQNGAWINIDDGSSA